jgi:hypothetical protein
MMFAALVMVGVAAVVTLLLYALLRQQDKPMVWPAVEPTCVARSQSIGLGSFSDGPSIPSGFVEGGSGSCDSGTDAGSGGGDGGGGGCGG